MIFYPLSTLMLGGIKEILIISNDETLPFYKKLFKDSSHLGISIEYALQGKSNCIAEAFIYRCCNYRNNYSLSRYRSLEFVNKEPHISDT